MRPNILLLEILNCACFYESAQPLCHFIFCNWSSKHSHNYVAELTLVLDGAVTSPGEATWKNWKTWDCTYSLEGLKIEHIELGLKQIYVQT